MSYNDEIKINELENQLFNQINSKKRAKTEILKMKRDILKYEETIKSLEEAIVETKKTLSELGAEFDPVTFFNN